MSLNRREFLAVGALTAALGVAAGHKAEAEEEPTPQSTEPQTSDINVTSIYEPDGEMNKWGTKAFGNWRTLAESRRLYGKEGGYGIFLPHQTTPIEIVQKRDDVHTRVLTLLASGDIPIDRTPIDVWE